MKGHRSRLPLPWPRSTGAKMPFSAVVRKKDLGFRVECSEGIRLVLQLAIAFLQRFGRDHGNGSGRYRCGDYDGGRFGNGQWTSLPIIDPAKFPGVRIQRSPPISHRHANHVRFAGN